MRIKRSSPEIIDAGKLRTPITVVSPLDTPNDRGGIVRTFPEENAIDLYGSITEWNNLRELQELASSFNDAKRVIIRYVEGMLSDWRLVIGGNDYTIHKIADLNYKQRYWEILCYTKVV